ncbi:hypothetical protein ACHBGV_04585 [Streptococcus sp. A34]|uniref:GntT/GntP/DsdX family permease n=1 Tax=Streptococcus sp. A34 TaxID=3373130 RepID=UPI00374D277F
MELISLIGMLFGIGFFIFLCVKGFNLVLSALLSAFIIILTSGLPMLELLKTAWAPGFASFIQNFFLIFAAGAIFGRLLNDGGASKSIAMGIYRAISKLKKNQKFWAVAFVPVMYAILSYVGVSGLVIVYTVIDVSAELFKKFNIPWRLYTNGGSAVIGALFIGGSLQLTNITPSQFTGQPITAGMGLSLICALVFYAYQAFFIVYDLKVAEKRGEGFDETGANFYAGLGNSSADEDLPSVLLSILPIVVMIALAGFLKVDVLYSITAGCILCVILFFKRYKALDKTITGALSSAYAPIFGVAATSAIGSVIKVVPGFALVTAGLDTFSPMTKGVLLISLVSFITATGAGAINSFGAEVNTMFTEQAGLTAATSHRLMAIAASTSISAHSPGVNNAMELAKLEYRKGIVVYLRTGLLGGVISIIVAMILIKLGIFV